MKVSAGCHSAFIVFGLSHLFNICCKSDLTPLTFLDLESLKIRPGIPPTAMALKHCIPDLKIPKFYCVAKK
jgi:hypothetical protein